MLGDRVLSQSLSVLARFILVIENPMISFKGANLQKDVFLYTVIFYVR